jgi:fumarate reductase flavoprotein subunit
MYRYHTPSGDKSCDGMAMALRAELTLRDLEMVQFHPTGLMAGPETRITGTIIEEGLRGAGGQLLGGDGRRFMPEYDPRAERATRDVVSRAMFEEIRKGNTGPNGGVYITMRHLPAADVRRQFMGLVERCADCGFDLVGGLVEVTPTAHYMMGGIVFDASCATEIAGLFAAGEDTGGVHGANRLGGNGVANSTVFGGVAGDSLARFVLAKAEFRSPDEAAIAAAEAFCRRPFDLPSGDISNLRERLHALMWEQAGIIRDRDGLARAAQGLTALEAELAAVGLGGMDPAFNLAWHDWLNVSNLILVSRAIVAAALARENSRGAHFRSDFPTPGAYDQSRYTRVRYQDGGFSCDTEAVRFVRVRPGESLLTDAAE